MYSICTGIEILRLESPCDTMLAMPSHACWLQWHRYMLIHVADRTRGRVYHLQAASSSSSPYEPKAAARSRRRAPSWDQVEVPSYAYVRPIFVRKYIVWMFCSHLDLEHV